MTENELRAVPPFDRLPVYDEADQRAGDNTTVLRAGPYERIQECFELEDLKRLLADRRLVPLGAIRARPTDGTSIAVAYFGVLPKGSGGGGIL